MNHRIRTSSERSATDLGRRVAAAIALVAGVVLLSPAVTAGAQTDEPIPDISVPEVDLSVPEDSTPDETTPGEDGTAPEDGEETDETTTTTTTTTPPAVEEEPVAENITMVFTADPVQGPCNGTPALVLKNYVGSDEQEFRLRIILEEPLCTPIDAVAAIYAMPGNGEAWPQTLVETLPFTLDAAGEYLVTFTKTCAAVQFDVITGDTPEVIAPLGEWHGPLLFPFDVSTSFQHWGCPEPEILGTTTVPEVQPEAAELAFTGSTATPAALVGAALLLVGAVMLLASRSRND